MERAAKAQNKIKAIRRHRSMVCVRVTQVVKELLKETRKMQGKMDESIDASISGKE